MEYIWAHKSWYHKIYGNPLKNCLPSYGPFGTIEITLYFVTISVTLFYLIDMAIRTFHNMSLYNKTVNLNYLEHIAITRAIDAGKLHKVKY